MKLTQHQKAILNYLKDGEKKKSQIVNRFKSWHYTNSSKHIGDILSRMVNRDLIIRVKKGVYSLNTHLQKNQNPNNQIGDVTGQINLFQ